MWKARNKLLRILLTVRANQFYHFLQLMFCDNTRNTWRIPVITLCMANQLIMEIWNENLHTGSQSKCYFARSILFTIADAMVILRWSASLDSSLLLARKADSYTFSIELEANLPTSGNR